MVRRYIPQRDGGSFRIRAGSNKDVAFVRTLSTEVFDQFGDYGTFLPTYLNHPSVLTAIGEEQGEPVGFIMLALVSSTRGLPWEGDAVAVQPDPAGDLAADPTDNTGDNTADNYEDDREWLDAEVLAIAVDPEHQSARVGTRLLQYALSCAEGWHRTMGVRSVQLNVAHTNRQAIRFFDTMGFIEIDPADGTYPKGQRSIRMARLIDPPR